MSNFHENRHQTGQSHQISQAMPYCYVLYRVDFIRPHEKLMLKAKTPGTCSIICVVCYCRLLQKRPEIAVLWLTSYPSKWQKKATRGRFKARSVIKALIESQMIRKDIMLCIRFTQTGMEKQFYLILLSNCLHNVLLVLRCYCYSVSWFRAIFPRTSSSWPC